MMKNKQITVRDVNPQVFQEFKAAAVDNGMRLGIALTLAMEKLRSELLRKKFKFTSLKPVDWGKGTERVSEEVDQILYGK